MTTLLLRSSKLHASAAAAITAASSLLVASCSSQPRSANQEEDDVTLNDDHRRAFSAKTVRATTSRSSPLLFLPSFLTQQAPSACHCDGTSGNNLSRLSKRTLRRMQTCQRMDQASTKGRTLESCYAIDRTAPPLGEGAFGAVLLGTNRATGEPVAVKRMPKSVVENESYRREIDMLLRIGESGGHPNICALLESFDEGQDYCLVLELVSGGEMFDHLCRRGPYSEAEAARLVREVASALAFLHGIGVVHADLKPENLMLSTKQASDAVVKLVDFGCSEVVEDVRDDVFGVNSNVETANDVATTIANSDLTSAGSGRGGHTPAYSPPESFETGRSVLPSVDMWSLGVILYIMLNGLHPFDLNGNASDEEVEERIRDPEKAPPIRNTPITAHLSESAIELIEKLMERDPEKRMKAEDMLEHPWVRGVTARTDIIEGSDERLGRMRAYKSRLQAKFFHDVVTWSDEARDETRRKTSLIERSFQSFDEKKRGFLTTQDLGQNFDASLSSTEAANTDESGQISMSDFDNLLSENMIHKYFPKGHVVYKEGDIGNHMYFINSGAIEVTTRDGSRAIRKQGDFFGEGALLHPRRIRSATIRCKTPVHTMEISREYFEKYLARSESGLRLTLLEKDKIRKRNRTKTILRLQNNLKEREYKMGDILFKFGEDGDSLFIVESGKVDIVVGDKHVLTATPGNVCGEYSLVTGRRRNSTAICTSNEGCIAQEMMGRDFRKLMDVSPEMKESLRDLCLRRDFKKAVVRRLNKEFPYHNPREAFDAVCSDSSDDCVLGVDEVGSLMREINPDYSDAEILEVIKTLNLTNSGTVTFDEFKKVFIADIRTAASM